MGVSSYYNNIVCNWKRCCPRQLGTLATLIRPTDGASNHRQHEPLSWLVGNNYLAWQSPAGPVSLGASEVATGAGVDAGLGCKQLLLWACLIAAVQMGLEKARVTDLNHWLRGPASAHQQAQGSRRWGRERTRSENYEKRSRRGESSLRLCGIALSCEPAAKVEKCLAGASSRARDKTGAPAA